MRIYVASKFENTEQVRSVMASLRAAGHTITFDWTTHNQADRQGPELYSYLQSCATDDAQGVLSAGAVLLLPVTAETPMAGAFTELGIAIARGIRVVVVDAFAESRQNNVFYFMPGVHHVKTVEEAIKHFGGGDLQIQ